MIRLLLFALLFAMPAAADNVFMDNTTSESNMCVIGITGQTTSNPAAVARATYSPITYTCAAGTYLPADGVECVTCTYGNYCTGGDYTYNETTAQGINPCPDPQTHQRTTFNTTTSTKNGKTVTITYNNPTITSTGFESSNTRRTITDCLVYVNIDTTEGHLYEFDSYNPTTQQYDLLNDFPGWKAANAGYYLTSKRDCAQNAYYGEVVQCPAGSYCPGVTELVSVRCDSDPATYWPDNKGLYACPNSYPSSDAGTSSEDYCYVAATCPTITDATNCDPHAATCAYTNDAVTSGRYYNGGNIATTAKCIMDFTCATGYTKTTKNNSVTSPDSNVNDQQCRAIIYPYGHTDNPDNDLLAGEWKATWTSGSSQGTLKGIASCNSVPGSRPGAVSWSTMPSNSNLMTNNQTGLYCWCKPTSWIPYGGDTQYLYTDWVFRGHISNCGFECAFYCTTMSLIAFRNALFNTINGGSPQCDANTITIDWSGYGAGNNQTQSTQCTYGGSITTPTEAPTKRGHVFVGWTFDLGN